jgi:hypothetical protein
MNTEDMETMAARMAVVMKILSHPMREAAASQQLGQIRRGGVVTARRSVPGFLHQTYCQPAAVAA